MKQPPTEGEEFSIRLKVVAISLFCPIVVMVFEAYDRVALKVGSEGDDAGKIVAPSEEVELYSCEESKEGKCIYQGKGSRYRCILLRHSPGQRPLFLHLQLIFSSLHSCALVFFGLDGSLSPLPVFDVAI